VRDRVVDYVRRWKDRTDVPAKRILHWMGVPEGTFYSWKQRYGKVNEHNGWIPRDHWLEDWEKRAILDFYWEHPLDGYRRLTYKMLDANVVAVSASSVYRVLKAAGMLDRHNMKPSRKGKGFHQPNRPHRHWHIDIAYLNLGGTFYYMCSILDGYSRFIVHWEIREQMTEQDVETILQRAREKFPGQTPRIISDNGPPTNATRRCPIAKDFKPTNLRSVPDPRLRHDSRENVTLLSTIQRQARTVSSHHQGRVHPAGNAALFGRRQTPGRQIRRRIQPSPVARRLGIHYAARQTVRPRGGDLGRTRPQAARSTPATGSQSKTPKRRRSMPRASRWMLSSRRLGGG
jgi:transposase-like protein